MSVYSWALGDETKSILLGISFRHSAKCLLNLKASSMGRTLIHSTNQSANQHSRTHFTL